MRCCISSGSWTKNYYYRGGGRCSSSVFGYQQVNTKSWNGVNRVVGENPATPHPYSMNYSYIDYGWCKEKSSQQTDVMSRCFGGVPVPPVYTWSSSDELQLLGKLAEQVRGHDFNAGVFAGTGHQTAHLIGDSALRLANGYRALKRGLGVKAIVNALNGARGRTTGRGKPLPHLSEHRDVELSRRWLEASYGWMPLLSDVDEACKALAKHVTGARQIKFRVRQRRHTFADEDTINTIGRSEREYRVQLIYELMNQDDTLLALRSLGVVDPRSILWELTPWSFAIDWMLPIGPWLETLAIVPHLTGRSTRTVFDIRTGKKTLKIRSGFEALMDQRVKVISLSRSVSSAQLKVPYPTAKSPLPSSWKRALNQLGVLGSLRSRY